MSIKLYWCRGRGNVDSTQQGFDNYPLPLVIEKRGKKTVTDVKRLVATLGAYLAMNDDQLLNKGEQVFYCLQEHRTLAGVRKKYLGQGEAGLRGVSWA
ncbi:hypothetical protein HX882_15330 [Pseudomonas gingeri]|uniref:Uncharacterized protein n=1 Tax=Pseudomonas gingeri TaxID=117681 RepID=A0A7Y7XCU4_9PSED|nr:hypothetical protein [Pseudomonas gingeri]NWB97270.1 hypothetical protein [Pseudomonas gingeri]